MTKTFEEAKRPKKAYIDPFSKRDVDFTGVAKKFTEGAQTLKEWKEYALLLEDKLKSQLEQQCLPEVPEFVAKTLEILKKYPNSTWSKLYESLGEEGVVWLNNYQLKDERFGFGGLNNKLFVLFHLAINGYTVQKPKRFYLKHTDMSKQDEKYDWYLMKIEKGGLNHSQTNKKYLPCWGDSFQFTQEEIDSMQTGSYEQIKVGE